jgi:hypothetical protein
MVLAAPLPIATLLYAKLPVCCHQTITSNATAAGCNEFECSPQAGKTAVPEQTGKPDATPVDPERQIVLKVDGLTCPAVQGIGCGHMLVGLLAALDKIDGVAGSSANYTGTMIRVSLNRGADRAKVEPAVRKLLSTDDRRVVPLTGTLFTQALEREQWRGATRIGELSAIEFRTLALHGVKTFGKAEKLDKKTADRLVKICDELWERICEEARAEGRSNPQDWGKRIKASLPRFLTRSQEVLTSEQVERLKETLTGQCADGERPKAPPAPPPGKKAS